MNSKQKALQINLDPQIYGSFAEIGAGQEVARYFFQAGGAAGTVAKTMSAYDMKMSDSIYGKEEHGRYVSESRMIRMLDHEYQLLLERLSTRGPTCFFAFSDTVAAKAYKANRKCHGWMGVRFQHTPGAPESQIHIHLKMLDNQNILQQKALGIIGVNLIHSSFFARETEVELITGLMDNLTTDQIQVDMLKTQGPAFKKLDDRILSLEAVKAGLTKAVLFETTGSVIPPEEELYRKRPVILRGSWRPPTLVNLDMLTTGHKKVLEGLPEKDQESIIMLPEISMSKLLERGEVDPQDFLARIELINSLGHRVMISKCERFSDLNEYMLGLTNEPISFVMGVYNMQEVFDKSNHERNPLGILGEISELFGKRTKVYLYPAYVDGVKVDTSNFTTHKRFKDIFSYLVQNELVVDITDFNPNLMDIWSRTVLRMIQNGEEGWQKMVPKSIAKTVKEKCLFGAVCNKE
ncbi:MAG: TonB-dependent receptor [Halobacteriovoraceae bacterium]|nr:TonB-dependent receptor [Halobacteriovoraceae bacterium]